MKIHDNSGNSNGGDFKNVLGCGDKKDSRGKSIIVDLTWRRGKVGDKYHEYQRFQEELAPVRSNMKIYCGKRAHGEGRDVRVENERRQQGRQLQTLCGIGRVLSFYSPLSQGFSLRTFERHVLSHDLIVLFPRGYLPVEDSEVRRTDDNLAPTIVKRFPSRTKVQAFTAEETLLTVALAVSYGLFFPYAKRNFTEHNTIRNRNIAAQR